MSALLLCAALLISVQTPTQRGARAPAAVAKRDTIYIAVQPPPPTVTVEAQSQLPAIFLGVAGLVLVWLQLRFLNRQTALSDRQTTLQHEQNELMSRQTTLLDRQTAIAAREAESRIVEAVGTFVRLAFDLAAEFRKANVLPGVQVMADYNSHPRASLREASRLFAPLGNAFVIAANQTAMRLDDYFTAVNAYNSDVRGREGAAKLEYVQHLREQVGRDLDQANQAIPDTNRWHYDNGKDYDFRARCSFPPGLLDGTTGGAPSGPQHSDVYQP